MQTFHWILHVIWYAWFDGQCPVDSHAQPPTFASTMLCAFVSRVAFKWFNILHSNHKVALYAVKLRDWILLFGEVKQWTFTSGIFPFINKQAQRRRESQWSRWQCSLLQVALFGTNKVPFGLCFDHFFLLFLACCFSQCRHYFVFLIHVWPFPFSWGGSEVEFCVVQVT